MTAIPLVERFSLELTWAGTHAFEPSSVSLDGSQIQVTEMPRVYRHNHPLAEP